MEDSLHIMRRMTATPEALFDAWLNPPVMGQWLFAIDPEARLTLAIDGRVGGGFSILEEARGNRINHFGHYIEIVRPRRLSFTLEVPEHFPGVTVVTVDIFPAFGGAELRFTQTGVAPKVTEWAWEQMFDKLQMLLEQEAS
jgi:uncharacterized protein YndB with AHSA1/START domain